jgi:acetyl esterase/lipase
LPDPSVANGTAIIVCPGGGYQVLWIDLEGNDIARWLNQKGIAAFVLKYRVGHTVSNDPWKEMDEKIKDKSFSKDIAPVIRLELEDAKASVSYIRQHATEFNIDSGRVGIMGFSAGGTASASLAYNYTPQTRPDFVAAFYAPIDPIENKNVQQDAPPVFIAAATDDQAVPASNSLRMYSDWLASKHSAELHIYSKGGHGLHEFPATTWKDRFSEWLDIQGLLKPKK